MEHVDNKEDMVIASYHGVLLLARSVQSDAGFVNSTGKRVLFTKANIH